MADAAAEATSAQRAASGTAAPTNTEAPAVGRLRVHELVEALHAVVHVARQRGTASARITLRPADLGGVQVRLRCRDGAVVAELRAETSGAVQALAQAGGDLRRALEAHGLVVQSLDVHLAADGGGARQEGDGTRGGAERQAAGGGHTPGDETETPIELSRLPAPGSQIDVLA